MIDFKKKKFEGNYGNDEEYKKLLADYTKTIQKDLAAVKTDFFYLGVHLENRIKKHPPKLFRRAFFYLFKNFL